jgi:hypothetical protein
MQRLCASAFIRFGSFSHFGTGRGRCFLRLAPTAPAHRARRFVMIALLTQGDRGLFITHAHLHAGRRRIDREVAVAQAPHQVERLPRRLLARHAQRVLHHSRLDRGSHLRGRAEEAIGGREPFQRLVRTLEVVVLHEQRRAALAIIEVGEDGARQELLPHRLPEALDLAARLRMVGAALHVRDAIALELLLEGGRAAPSRVLATLIGEDLARRTVVRDRARQRLHHQRALLVVCHHQAHQVARMIVHERGYIDALLPAQQEGEEIGLPQLVRLGALESLRRRLRTRFAPRRRMLLHQTLLAQHSSHRRLRRAQTEEAPNHVANAPASCLRLGALHRNHGLSPRIRHRAIAHNPRRRHARQQRLCAPGAILAPPLADRGVRNVQRARHLACVNSLIHDHRGRRLHHVKRPRRLALVGARVPLALRYTFSLRAHSMHSSRAPCAARSEEEC